MAPRDAALDAADRRLILNAFREPRGFYSAHRAAQLSGVPERTVYHWATEGVVVPDHGDDSPKAWSYRDLVYLRLIAFLRTHRVDLRAAADLVGHFRLDFENDRVDVVTHVAAAQGGYALGKSMEVDEITGQNAFDIMADIAGHFDLVAALDEHAREVQLRGPNLLRPSGHTSISPWVMSGEPVVRDTRIATATLFALHEDRGLESSDIAALYPSLETGDVSDALAMESSLRAAA